MTIRLIKSAREPVANDEVKDEASRESSEIKCKKMSRVSALSFSAIRRFDKTRVVVARVCAWQIKETRVAAVALNNKNRRYILLEWDLSLYMLQFVIDDVYPSLWKFLKLRIYIINFSFIYTHIKMGQHSSELFSMLSENFTISDLNRGNREAKEKKNRLQCQIRRVSLVARTRYSSGLKLKFLSPRP